MDNGHAKQEITWEDSGTGYVGVIVSKIKGERIFFKVIRECKMQKINKKKYNIGKDVVTNV